MIILELEVVAKGTDVGSRLGNPQTLKPGVPANENQPPASTSLTTSGKPQGKN